MLDECVTPACQRVHVSKRNEVTCELLDRSAQSRSSSPGRDAPRIYRHSQTLLSHCLAVSLPCWLTDSLHHCLTVCLAVLLPRCLSALLPHCPTVSLPPCLTASLSCCLPTPLSHCLYQFSLNVFDKTGFIIMRTSLLLAAFLMTLTAAFR